MLKPSLLVALLRTVLDWMICPVGLSHTKNKAREPPVTRRAALAVCEYSALVSLARAFKLTVSTVKLYHPSEIPANLCPRGFQHKRRSP